MPFKVLTLIWVLLNLMGFFYTSDFLLCFEPNSENYIEQIDDKDSHDYFQFFKIKLINKLSQNMSKSNEGNILKISLDIVCLK